MNNGAIAGGIIGGVGVTALFTGIVLWFTVTIRRRRARAALSAAYFDGQDPIVMGHVMAPYSPALTNEPPPLYVRILLFSFFAGQCQATAR